MLAHGVRAYHRPATLEAALELCAAGARPIGGGTRVLASPTALDQVVDLCALPLDDIGLMEEDLHLGATVTLQDAIDSEVAHDATAGLLPEACRAASPSRMMRGMATLAGEAIHGAHDSEVVAALLALNAVFVVRRGAEELESPALRFIRHVEEDVGRGLVTGIVIGGAPDGAALERVAVLPSAPALVAAAATVSWAGDVCARARLVITGLQGPPSRMLEAESRLEGSSCDAAVLDKALEQVVIRSEFRDDAHASADYRRKIAPVVARRALLKAIARAKDGTRATGPHRWPHPHADRRPGRMLQFVSGPLQVGVNGRTVKAEASAGESLLQWLRGAGVFGVKHGCETGECGACAVLLDGRPVNACLTLAARAHGRDVQTIEGLGTPDALHPVQQAFVDTGAIQCGFCTPAMELLGKALLDAVAEPDEADVRDALAGCLCRCTGYVKPVQAVLQAARARGTK